MKSLYDEFLEHIILTINPDEDYKDSADDDKWNLIYIIIYYT